MRIVNAGINYRHSEKFMVNRPSGSGDYILLVVKTNAFFIFSEKKILTDKGAVVLFKKGTHQHYGAYGEPFSNDWIHFEISPDEEAEITKLNIPFDTVLYPSNSPEISRLINDVFTERYSENTHRESTLELYFKLIMLKLSDGISRKNPFASKPFYNALSKLRNEIISSPEVDRNIDKLCKNLNMSRSYLQHLYKQYFGMSVTEEIKMCRMEHAKYLLSGTDMLVSLISLECGYSSDIHFMRIFKKTVGISPTEYRKSTAVAVTEIENSRKMPPFNL